jgi:hypothetical protein
VHVRVRVVWALALYSLLNIMRRSSPAFSREKKKLMMMIV